MLGHPKPRRFSMDIEVTTAEAVDQKEAFWRRTLEAWKDSGLSGSAFQRQNNLSKNAFGYWKRKLMARSEEAQTFMPVSIRRSPRCPGAPGASYIRLRVGGVYTVEVTSGFDAKTLREVLAVVQDFAG
jgi:hypothetical protein